MTVRNTLDYNLVESYRREIDFTSIDPDVALIGDGVILPGTDGLIFPFKAVNLKAVNVRIIRIFEDNIGQFFQENQYNGKQRVETGGTHHPEQGDRPELGQSSRSTDTWNIFSLDLADLIEAEPGAIYNVSITFDRSQSLLPCAAGEVRAQPEALQKEQGSGTIQRSAHRRLLLGLFIMKTITGVSGKIPAPIPIISIRKNTNEASRNVLASDLGIIAKGGSGTDLFVAVTSLVSSEPMPGVELEIYNYQNQLDGSEADRSERNGDHSPGAKALSC